MKTWANHITVLGSGRPLVFFHGWGFDHKIWLSLALAIQDRFSVYLIDLPGFGNSPLISWALFKKTLLANLPPRFALIGWSMGGLFATRLAFEEPTRVSHLFSIASSPYFIKDSGWPGIAMESLQTFRVNLLQNPLLSMQQFISQCSPLGAQFQSKNMLNEEQLEGLLAGLEVLSTWDLRECLGRLNCPTFFLFSQHDNIVPRTVLKVIQKKYPMQKAEYVLFTKSGHDPFVTEPDRFIGEIEGFIA